MARALARVVIPAQGEHYVAWYAAMHTLDGAFVLGTIHIGAVHRHQHRMRDWIDLLKHIAHELTIDAVRKEVHWCDIVVEEEG